MNTGSQLSDEPQRNAEQILDCQKVARRKDSNRIDRIFFSSCLSIVQLLLTEAHLDLRWLARN